MQKNLPLILASSSKIRLELLNTINIKPDLIISPDIDETRKKNEKPLRLAARLAETKALKIAADLKENSIILAADTVVCKNHQVFDKALNAEMVHEYLNKFSGRRIHVITAIAGLKIEKQQIIQKNIKVVDSYVKFKRLSENEINFYVESNLGIGTAGGLAIEGLGQILIKQIFGSHSGIMGLPLYETTNLLNSLGYNVFLQSKSKA